MRIKVTKLVKSIRHSDGSYTHTRLPAAQLSDNFDDSQVTNAIKHFTEHRDIQPLACLLEEGNPGVLRNRMALKLLAESARGNLKIGQGRIKTQKSMERNKRILLAAKWIQRLGLPIKNNPEKKQAGHTQSLSACRAIGDYLNLSETAVYSIVRSAMQAEKKRLEDMPELKRQLIGDVEFEIGPPWKWDDETPTVMQVLEHYLSDRNSQE